MSTWKRARRSKDRYRVPLGGKRCERCGVAQNLTRHHEWRLGGSPVVVILCDTCHQNQDRTVGPPVACPICGVVKMGKRKLKRHLGKKHDIRGKEKRAIAKGIGQ